MPKIYRTPNCTFMNVGQFRPKFYRKPFQLGLLDYIYVRIARAEFHLKVQENRSYSTLAS